MDVQNLFLKHFQKNSIYYIFILFLFLRLIGITNELNDYHHFRQTYTASFAKYFYENGFDLFNPNLSIINYKNISEFQIFPFLVALLYKIFGFHDYLGRVLSLIFSIGTFFVFYWLVELYFNKLVANIALIFLTILPLSIFYSRVFMLEPMMLFLSVSMLYTFSRYLEDENLIFFVISIVCTSLTLLIKIPTIYMLLPILFLMINKNGFRFLFQISNYIYGFFSILPAVYWYFIHNKIFPKNSIVDERIINLYYGSDAWDYYLQLMKVPGTWESIYLKSIAEYHLAIIVFIFFLLGLYLYFKGLFIQNNKIYLYSSKIWLFFYWFIGFNFFILAFIAPNLAHEYYQLPIVLPCIVIASYFVAVILNYNNKIYNIIIYILILSILPFSAFKLKARLTQDTFYNQFSEYVKKYTKKESLIIVVDNTPRTEVFYFSDRNGFQLIIPAGFTFLTVSISDKQLRELIKDIEKHRKQGATFLVTPYIEFPSYMSYLKEYLDKNYECKLGCDVTKERSLLKDKTIPGFIYDISTAKKKSRN